MHPFMLSYIIQVNLSFRANWQRAGLFGTYRLQLYIGRTKMQDSMKGLFIEHFVARSRGPVNRNA